MRIVNELHEDNIIKELSTRFKQYRIDSAITQVELAKKSDVSVRTISRFEKGEDIGLVTVIKLFKALGLAKNFEVMIPDMTQRPSFYSGKNSNRKRASSQGGGKTAWKWGDEK